MIELLLILATVLVLLLAIDIVYESIWIPLVGYSLVAIAILGFGDADPWMVVLALPLFVLSLLALQYFLWRRWLLPGMVNQFAPSRHVTSNSRLQGAVGRVVEVDGEVFVSVHDELWPFEPKLPVGASVRIQKIRDGTLQVDQFEE